MIENLEITGDTTMCFEIKFTKDDKQIEAIVELHNSEWTIISNVQQGRLFLAQGRVHWIEAVRRALVRLT